MDDSSEPEGWFRNPIFRREIQQAARRRFTYILRIVYGLFVLLTLWLVYQSLRDVYFYSISDSAVVGRALYGQFFALQLFFATIVAMVSGADLLHREMKGDTLGLLSLTALGPFRIVSGKWLAAMSQPACLVLCGMPVLVSCAFLGGVGPSHVAMAVAVPLSSACLGAAYAVRAASQVRSGIASGLVSIGMYFGHYFLAGLAGVALHPFVPGVAGIFHPLAAISLMNSAEELTCWPLAAALAAPISWLILRGAAGRLAHAEALQAHPVQLSADIESRRAYASEAAANLGMKWREAAVSDAHPLLWKEIRTRPAAHVSCEIRLFVLILTGIAVLAGLLSEGLSLVPHVMAVLFGGLAVPAGAALFSRDRENRRWEPLLSSPVRARDLVAAKLLATPLSPEGKVLILQGLLSALILMKSMSPAAAMFAAASVAIYVALIYVLSGAASLVTRGARSAMALGAAASLTILFGLPWIEGALAPVGSRSPFERPSLTGLFHPIFEVTAPNAPLAFALRCGGNALLIALVVRWMVRRLDRQENRSSS